MFVPGGSTDSLLAVWRAGALPWLKDPFEHEQEEPLREVMTVPLLEQLHREARGFALTAALAVGLVRSLLDQSRI